MSDLQNILDEKSHWIYSVLPSATVAEAVDEMCLRHVGALMVQEDDELLGIISERDVMTRVVLRRLDPDVTRVGSVMTTDLVCATLDTEPEEVERMMTEHRCRHIPVVEDGRLVGLVSIGDLLRRTTRRQEYELRSLRDYVVGVYPG